MTMPDDRPTRLIAWHRTGHAYAVQYGAGDAMYAMDEIEAHYKAGRLTDDEHAAIERRLCVEHLADVGILVAMEEKE